MEHQYDRGGSLAYLAAWDVHRGKVSGRGEPTTGIAPFGRLVEQAMNTEPYVSANRVFWIVDNGSSHRGQASIDRMTTRWPQASRLKHMSTVGPRWSGTDVTDFEGAVSMTRDWGRYPVPHT